LEGSVFRNLSMLKLLSLTLLNLILCAATAAQGMAAPDLLPIKCESFLIPLPGRRVVEVSSENILYREVRKKERKQLVELSPQFSVEVLSPEDQFLEFVLKKLRRLDESQVELRTELRNQLYQILIEQVGRRGLNIEPHSDVGIRIVPGHSTTEGHFFSRLAYFLSSLERPAELYFGLNELEKSYSSYHSHKRAISHVRLGFLDTDLNLPNAMFVLSHELWHRTQDYYRKHGVDKNNAWPRTFISAQGPISFVPGKVLLDGLSVAIANELRVGVYSVNGHHVEEAGAYEFELGARIESAQGVLDQAYLAPNKNIRTTELNMASNLIRESVSHLEKTAAFVMTDLKLIANDRLFLKSEDGAKAQLLLGDVQRKLNVHRDKIRELLTEYIALNTINERPFFEYTINGEKIRVSWSEILKN